MQVSGLAMYSCEDQALVVHFRRRWTSQSQLQLERRCVRCVMLEGTLYSSSLHRTIHSIFKPVFAAAASSTCRYEYQFVFKLHSTGVAVPKKIIWGPRTPK